MDLLPELFKHSECCVCTERLEAEVGRVSDPLSDSALRPTCLLHSARPLSFLSEIKNVYMHKTDALEFLTVFGLLFSSFLFLGFDLNKCLHHTCLWLHPEFKDEPSAARF